MRLYIENGLKIICIIFICSCTQYEEKGVLTGDIRIHSTTRQFMLPPQITPADGHIRLVGNGIDLSADAINGESLFTDIPFGKYEISSSLEGEEYYVYPIKPNRVIYHVGGGAATIHSFGMTKVPNHGFEIHDLNYDDEFRDLFVNGEFIFPDPLPPPHPVSFYLFWGFLGYDEEVSSTNYETSFIAYVYNLDQDDNYEMGTIQNVSVFFLPETNQSEADSLYVIFYPAVDVHYPDRYDQNIALGLPSNVKAFYYPGND